MKNNYFLPYQERWLNDKSKIKIWEKSRRIGATYVQSYEDVRDCVNKKVPAVWFSSADESAAKEYIDYCEQWVKLFHTTAKRLGEIIIDNDKDIKAFVIQFSNGTKIHALSSNPKDIRSALEKSLTEGKTFREFSKELKPTLQKKGWWGEQIIVDSEGIAEKVQLGSLYRLKTIYSVNMQTAYQTGRYKTQYENVDNRPYWEYVAVMDASTRPEHAMLNGLVYRYDDPFWKSFYPPNGWRCRCRVVALSDYNVQKKKRTVSTSTGTLSEELVLVSKKSGEYKPVTVYTDPLTGKRVAPDVGWSHNPASDLIDDYK